MELTDWTVSDFGGVVCPDHDEILVLDESTPEPERWHCPFAGGCANYLSIARYRASQGTPGE